ncbi:MAG TPA: hypothetical protein VER78_01050 [Thermoanaerobaculia bacterium]|nr:hypothetical protein [Thermoanaerobaculia bacterium]
MNFTARWKSTPVRTNWTRLQGWSFKRSGPSPRPDGKLSAAVGLEISPEMFMPAISDTMPPEDVFADSIAPS